MQRCACLLGSSPFACSRIEFRIDRAGLDVVNGDAPVSDLPGQPLREHSYGSLGCGIGHKPRRHDALADTRTDRDDAAIVVHVLQGRLRHDEDATKVDPDHAVPTPPALFPRTPWGMAVPALFTSTSSLPKEWTVFSTAALTAWGSVASAWTAIALPPACSM